MRRISQQGNRNLAGYKDSMKSTYKGPVVDVMASYNSHVAGLATILPLFLEATIIVLLA